MACVVGRVVGQVVGTVVKWVVSMVVGRVVGGDVVMTVETGVDLSGTAAADCVMTGVGAGVDVIEDVVLQQQPAVMTNTMAAKRARATR